MNKSIIYKIPVLYEIGLSLRHGRMYELRNKLIADLVISIPEARIIDIGCGTGKLADYVPQNYYLGIDLNKTFIDFAKKHRGSAKHKFLHRDILDPLLYKDFFSEKTSFQYAVISDILHHIPKKDVDFLLKKVWNSVNTALVFCEPYHFADRKSFKRIPLLGNLLGNISLWFDNDGINKISHDNYYTYEELIANINNKFNTILDPAAQFSTQLGEDIITVFFKDRHAYEEIISQNKVSAIVPAYNEEQTVKNVVEALIKSPLINEVISVNDGSRDYTSSALKSIDHPKHTFVDIRQNRGKGYAVAQGVKKSTGDIILMVDADLSNLRFHHIEFLVTPLFFKELSISCVLGLLGKKRSLLSHLTGERAYFRKDFVQLLPLIEKTKYGIETILNYYFTNNEILIVKLPELKHYTKIEKKLSTKQIAIDYLNEGLEIAIMIARIKFLSKSELNIIYDARDLLPNNFRKAKKTILRIKDPLVKYVLNQYIKKIKILSQNNRRNISSIINKLKGN